MRGLALHASRLLRTLELRIDVEHGQEELEAELRALHERLHCRGDPLCGIAVRDCGVPGFAVRYREADGEYYCYVEDVASARLAGYTVFNRLIEVDRRADRHLRAPHSKFAPAYQRRGLATALYRWYLDTGRCLISGARQSPGAHALWQSLGTHYPAGYVQVRDKQMRWLGKDVPPAVLNDLHTRMVLLGNGWSVARLARATGMAMMA
ncbi:N-acetyltransferase [Cupriavidus sp. AU9028]|nr:N-acetyltransferase [Cupriavidus sp. AU9028]